MRHFYLVWNPYKEGTRSMAEEIREWLCRRGCVCGMQTNGGARPAEGRYKYTDSSQVPEDTECVLTLGGDGTLIQAARDLAGRQIPMLGVNMGNLGYLTQVSRREELEEVLQALLEDRFRLERRMMLKGSVIRDGQEICSDVALNEIVISRREMLRMPEAADLCQWRDAESVSRRRHDCRHSHRFHGLQPFRRRSHCGAGRQNDHSDAVCPHTLNGRSIVLSSEDQVEIEVLGHDDAGQAAVFDGDSSLQLKVGDRLRAERSRTETVLIQLRAGSFFDNLRSKLAGI